MPTQTLPVWEVIVAGSLLIIIAPLFALALLTVAVVLIWRTVRGAGVQPPERQVFSAEGTRAVARHLLLWRWASVLAALAIGLALLNSTSDVGRWASVAPAAAAVAFLVGALLGEFTSPRHRAAVRTASLARRGPLDAVSRWGLWLVAAGLVTLAGILTYAVVVAIPDDLGRPGRAVSARGCAVVTNADGSVTEQAANGTHGPWPGSWYAVPIALTLLLAVVLAAITLAVIARRPRPAGAASAHDELLRRHSAGRVLAALGVGVFGTLWPVAAAMASGVAADSPCGASGLELTPMLLVGIALAGLVGTLSSVALLLVGLRRVAPDSPSGPPASAGMTIASAATYASYDSATAAGGDPRQSAAGGTPGAPATGSTDGSVSA